MKEEKIKKINKVKEFFKEANKGTYQSQINSNERCITDLIRVVENLLKSQKRSDDIAFSLQDRISELENK